MLYDFTMRAAAMAVLCALAECMIPEGKLKKTVSFCIGLVFVLCLAESIVSLLMGAKQ